MQPAACGREVRFAPDSLPEGAGFEPSVPLTRLILGRRAGQASWEGPRVRGLAAGGNRIRTVGPAEGCKNRLFSMAVFKFPGVLSQCISMSCEASENPTTRIF